MAVVVVALDGVDLRVVGLCGITIADGAETALGTMASKVFLRSADSIAMVERAVVGAVAIAIDAPDGTLSVDSSLIIESLNATGHWVTSSVTTVEADADTMLCKSVLEEQDDDEDDDEEELSSILNRLPS